VARGSVPGEWEPFLFEPDIVEPAV
jgi:hypothetical protein